MATKTINLTGAEVAVVELDGAHAHIRNDSTDTIYAAKTAGITAGADGVASIPAGQADTLRGISGAVYLLGTGSALIQSDDYVESPFKASTASGGSAVDDVARAAVSTHAGNADIHVTADEKAVWNGKAELTDIPSSLPANGGNADTLDGLHANEIASNPNLLIDSDFRINQRAETSYSTAGYTVDGWKLFSTVSGSLGSVAVSDDGVTLTGGDNAMDAYLCQFLEDSYGNKFAGKTVTVSFEVENVTGLGICVAQYGRSESSNLFARVTSDGIYAVTGVWEPLSITNRHALMFYNRDAYSSAKIKWVKLEIGSISSPFCPPDPATELAKCQRYYQIRSTGDIAEVDLRPSMRATPTITQLSDGNYAYSAEL